MRLAEVTASGTGRRGAGLGNEALAWGKAMLAADALDLRLLAPRWLTNRYALGDQLGIGRGAMLRAELAARLAPSRDFTENLYRETGRVDYGAAVIAASDAGRLDGARVLVTSGMWGGYAAIAGSRLQMHEAVRSAPGAEKLAISATDHSALTVGLHVRRGDFGTAAPAPGTFNRSLPVSWFAGVIRSLTELFPEAAYVVCTDAADGELVELTDKPSVRVVRGEGVAAPVQELSVLAACDLLVCSVSSFSMLAAFLSDRPYLWYAPQLTVVDGSATIWGMETSQRVEGSPTRRALALRDDHVRARGIPVGADGTVRLQTEDLAAPVEGWDRRRDLLYYGAVPDGAPGTRGGRA